MNCIFCESRVFGEEGTTVLGQGPAHKSCLQVKQVERRVFKGVDLESLSEGELNDLLELTKLELNSRSVSYESAVELF